LTLSNIIPYKYLCLDEIMICARRRGPEFAYPDQGSGPGSERARAQAQKKYLTGYWVLWYDPI